MALHKRWLENGSNQKIGRKFSETSPLDYLPTSWQRIATEAFVDSTRQKDKRGVARKPWGVA